ncbi:MAG: hypothetical protein WCF04_05185, partial [Candidatus Nanopelagicales bacterium]
MTWRSGGVGAGVSAFLQDFQNNVLVQVAGALLIAPAVLGFLALCAFELRRLWLIRQGRSVDLQSVVRGTGAGLFAAPMPGRLHLTPDGVWWVAEGDDRPVPVRGVVVNAAVGAEVSEDLPSLSEVCPGAPHVP